MADDASETANNADWASLRLPATFSIEFSNSGPKELFTAELAKVNKLDYVAAWITTSKYPAIP
jgi:hypothetical protein